MGGLLAPAIALERRGHFARVVRGLASLPAIIIIIIIIIIIYYARRQHICCCCISCGRVCLPLSQLSRYSIEKVG